MSSATRTREIQRRNAYKKLGERFGIDQDNTSGTEDYLDRLTDETPMDKWAVITVTGDHFYIYDRSTLDDAKYRADLYMQDDIYVEYPHMIVNLDTGEERLPKLRVSWGTA